MMYHYVREILNSPYPNVKGLEFSGFRRQLDYLLMNYEMISANHLIEYLRGGIPALPANSCLLTFDDGFKDHTEYVLPELKRRGLDGCFFPSAKPIVEQRLLDVHAVQFILTCCKDIFALVSDLKAECIKIGFTENDIADWWPEAPFPSRYDSAEVVFVKSVLQMYLPEEHRSSIVKKLFERYVGRSENEFSKELYMSQDDVKDLIMEGMYVGSHSYSHYHMNACDVRTQELEIDKSLKFISDVGGSTSDWIFNYPHGSYNNETLNILVDKKCIAGFTTKVGIASLENGNALELSRYDTNDFPQ